MNNSPQKMKPAFGNADLNADMSMSQVGNFFADLNPVSLMQQNYLFCLDNSSKWHHTLSLFCVCSLQFFPSAVRETAKLVSNSNGKQPSIGILKSMVVLLVAAVSKLQCRRQYAKNAQCWTPWVRFRSAFILFCQPHF